MSVQKYTLLPKLFRFLVLPYAILMGTISHFYNWQRAGIITSKKIRYLAYFFLIWLNAAVWGGRILEVLSGCNLLLPRTILLMGLVIMFLILGLTNYIPRHPPFSQRRKIFVFTTFLLALILPIISCSQLLNSNTTTDILIIIGTVSAFACVMSIIRPQGTESGPCKCSGCET